MPSHDTALSLRMAKYRRVASSKSSERSMSVASSVSGRRSASAMKERLDLRELEKEGAAGAASAPGRRRNIWMLRNLPTSADAENIGTKCGVLSASPPLCLHATYPLHDCSHNPSALRAEGLETPDIDRNLSCTASLGNTDVSKDGISMPAADVSSNVKETMITLPGLDYYKWERQLSAEECQIADDEGTGVLTLVLSVTETGTDHLLMSPVESKDTGTNGEAKTQSEDDGNVVRRIKREPKLLSIVEKLTGIGTKSAAQTRLSLRTSGIVAAASEDVSPLLLSNEHVQQLRLQLVDYQRPKRLWANLTYGKTARMSTVSYFSVGMAVGCVVALMCRLIIAIIDLLFYSSENSELTF